MQQRERSIEDVAPILLTISISLASFERDEMPQDALCFSMILDVTGRLLAPSISMKSTNKSTSRDHYPASRECKAKP